MIFKPAELTPITAGYLAEVYTEAGLPDGAFNVVHGEHYTQVKMIYADLGMVERAY